MGFIEKERGGWRSNEGIIVSEITNGLKRKVCGQNTQKLKSDKSVPLKRPLSKIKKRSHKWMNVTENDKTLRLYEAKA